VMSDDRRKYRVPDDCPAGKVDDSATELQNMWIDCNICPHEQPCMIETTAALVHPLTLIGPGWQCPSFIVPLVCIKLGIPNDDAAPPKVSKWLSEQVKYKEIQP